MSFNRYVFTVYFESNELIVNHFIVSRWEACSEIIRKMFQPLLIFNQLQLTIELTKCFLEVNCPVGAKSVVDATASYFTSASDYQGQGLIKAEVHSYLNLIISLEEDSSIPNRERFTSFAAFFSKLQPYLQCQLVIDFGSKYESQWKSLPRPPHSSRISLLLCLSVQF